MKISELSMDTALNSINDTRPILIAGCTASGKSEFALHIAERHGGIVINADAMQVYENWSVLTARPPEADLIRAPHALYGHVSAEIAYNVGDWLRDIRPYLTGDRPIIVGGTGLFFRALTEGLADIPAVDPDIRAQADVIPLNQLIADLDNETAQNLDLNNRARVQRAWEVQRFTGKSILHWQKNTPPPDLALKGCHAFLLDSDTDWLNDRISRRFDLMLQNGALEEAENNLTHWNSTYLSSRVIGAPELISYLKGEIDFDTARQKAIIASRQYAKRQRTWFRKRMLDWQHIPLGQP